MRRLLSFVPLAALLIVAAAFVGCSSDSGGDDSTAAEGDSPGDGGQSVAGACIEGTVDCVDTFEDPGDPALGRCAEDATAPECVAEEPPLDPAGGPGAVTYTVVVTFDESVEQAGIDRTDEIVRSAGPDAEYVIQESFPPVGRASVTSGEDEVCSVLTEQLMDVDGVGDVSCEEAQTGGGAPDEPVSSP
ncbi:MAG: hypothetical protein WD939_07065 [Dehalococcoidia bacterium]